MLRYVFLVNGKLNFVCAILQSCRKMKNKLVRSINCRFSERARFDFEPLAMDKRWKRFLVVVFCLLFDVNSILDQQTADQFLSERRIQILLAYQHPASFISLYYSILFHILYELRFSDWLICTTRHWVVPKQPHIDPWRHYRGVIALV